MYCYNFLYICANPFIYAIKFDPVRRILKGLVLCKVSEQAEGNVEMTGHSTGTRRN